MVDQNKVYEDIFSLCSDKLLNRFIGFGGFKDVTISHNPEGKISDDVNYRAEIILYGSDMTLRIQIFFCVESYHELLKHIYTEVTDKRVIDFQCELCNLTGGKIKEVAVEQGIVVALSLPMNAETDKLKLINSKNVLSEVRHFDLMMAEKVVLSSKVSFEIHNLEKFSNFKADFTMSNVSDGDVEFL